MGPVCINFWVQKNTELVSEGTERKGTAGTGILKSFIVETCVIPNCPSPSANPSHPFHPPLQHRTHAAETFCFSWRGTDRGKVQTRQGKEENDKKEAQASAQNQKSALVMDCYELN